MPTIARPLGFSALLTLAAACGATSPRPTPPALTTATVTTPTVAATTPPPPAPPPTDAQLAALHAKVDQFAPAVLTADISGLPDSEKQALRKILAAAKLLDPVFDRQAWSGNPALRAKLVDDATPYGKATLAYFDIMRGPWDRQAAFAPFAIDHARPKGAGFYPEDMTADELHAYTAKHPEQKDALESLTTVVVRDGSNLRAVPYSQTYTEWLKPSAALLQDAAKLTKDATLAKFLTSRAAAFLSDDYFQSDMDWMDLDSRVDVTIGPYETYEDDLLGLKASFEAYVTLSDPAASTKLEKYKSMLPDMEKNLPIPDEVHGHRGSASPIRVVDLLYSSGNARESVQAIAYNLPNDERVRAAKGAKKVLLRNLIEAKFDRIMHPIGERILDASQLQYLASEAFFDETLFHELSHSLGPDYVVKGGQKTKVEVRVALEASFSAIEECKADVTGAYNILYMVKRGELPPELRQKLLVSYFAGLFRSTRFGVAEAHGQGAAVQINRYLAEGGAMFDSATGKFTVDFTKLEAAIGHLVHDLCMLESAGDKAAADAFLAKNGVASDPITRATQAAVGIPVDVNPSYPTAE